MEQFDETQASDAAWKFLRSNTTATLKFGEHSQHVSYVICPTGELVIPAMVAMLQPCDTIMFVPEYCDNCMEMHVSLRQFNEEGEEGLMADRWNVYHGESPDVQWAIVDIDAARFHEMFIDGEALCRESLLADIEHSLCKEINTNLRDNIRRVCLERTNVDVTDPVVVGIDSIGVDVRAPFGIVHIPSIEPITSQDDVLDLFSK
jgi:hypothetical protein